MQKTGELLRKTREEKKLSLHEIGLALKIGTKVLKAIEEGDEKNLPAKTFLRGFVRSYAAYLRLDVDEVLNMFQEEMGSTRPPGAIARATPEVTPNELPKHFSEPEAVGNVKHSNSMKPMFFAIICVFAVAIITGTKKIIEKYQKEAEIAAVPQTAKPIETKDPAPEMETPASVTNALAESANNDKGNSTGVNSTIAPNSGAANPLATTKANGPANPANANSTPATAANSSGNAMNPNAASVKANTNSPSGASATTTGASPSAASSATTNKAAATATTTAAAAPNAVAAKPAVSASPTPGSAQAANKSLELIVEAMESVDIEYSAPGGKTEKIKLSAEQVHTFKSKAGLRLSVSNGGAINLILNGKDLGVPGEIGKPIKLSY